LVSFSYRPDSTIYEHRLPETGGKVDLTKMTEMITLDKAQIDSLTHILFNVGYRGKILTGRGVGCYNPRNAILFMDASGSAFAFFEICFECEAFRMSPRINPGEFCDEKYSMLKHFFIRNGIEIGTVKGIRP
jgi:hypothetical protein